jgi:hypothetical protein
MATNRCRMKPSSIGIGFSHQSVPSVVEDRDPLLRWEIAGSGLDELDDRLRCCGVVPGAELRHPRAPLVASAIFSSA